MTKLYGGKSRASPTQYFVNGGEAALTLTPATPGRTSWSNPSGLTALGDEPAQQGAESGGWRMSERRLGHILLFWNFRLVYHPQLDVTLVSPLIVSVLCLY